MGQGKTKSHYLKIFKSQYLVAYLRYGPIFFHVIITFIDFEKAFCNIRSQGAPLLIFRGWRLAPPQDFVAISKVRVDRVNKSGTSPSHEQGRSKY